MIDWLFIYKNKSGHASLREKRRYLKWLSKKSEHRRYAEQVEKYHLSDGEFTPLSEPELLHNLYLLHARLFDNNQRIRRRRIIIASSVAAALAILSMVIYTLPFVELEPSLAVVVQPEISVPTLILENGKSINLEQCNSGENTVEKVNETTIACKAQSLSSSIEYNRIVIPSKYTYTIILGDGTEVTLNANSELRYPTDFNGTTREVFLKGEGYFNVKKDSIPFVVRTSELCVKVYGTKFNINTHNRNVTETLLISGLVGVTIDGNDEMMMNPMELFSYNRNNGEVVVKTVEPENYLAWKDNFFKSDNERLTNLLDEIERWYGVTFQYDDTRINNISVNSLLLKRTLTIENILRAIEEISDVKFITENENNYVIEYK